MYRFFFAVVACLPTTTLRADFSYQDTTQMTGGSLVNALRMLGPFARGSREATVSTHMIKGNRMASVTKDRTTILDLDKETITTIDTAKKTYSVMTFAEMKQMMEDAKKKMEEAQQKMKGQNPAASGVQMNAKVSSNATGQTKTVQGLTAKEIVTTITMEMQAADQPQQGQPAAMTIVTDSWLAIVPGYDEVKAFYMKAAAKVGSMIGSSMPQIGMMRADVSKGLEESAKELAKLDGVPVETVTKMSSAGGPSAGGGSSGASSDGSAAQNQSNAPNSPAAALGRLAGIGGLGGFGRNRKKTDDQQQAPPDQPQQQSGSSSTSLIETTTQMNSFSSAPIDGSKFEVPAGFKQVQSDLRRGIQ
jgi:hypothetical protein